MKDEVKELKEEELEQVSGGGEMIRRYLITHELVFQTLGSLMPGDDEKEKLYDFDIEEALLNEIIEQNNLDRSKQ